MACAAAAGAHQQVALTEAQPRLLQGVPHLVAVLGQQAQPRPLVRRAHAHMADEIELATRVVLRGVVAQQFIAEQPVRRLAHLGERQRNAGHAAQQRRRQRRLRRGREQHRRVEVAAAQFAHQVHLGVAAHGGRFRVQRGGAVGGPGRVEGEQFVDRLQVRSQDEGFRRGEQRPLRPWHRLVQGREGGRRGQHAGDAVEPHQQHAAHVAPAAMARLGQRARVDRRRAVEHGNARLAQPWRTGRAGALFEARRDHEARAASGMPDQQRASTRSAA